MKSLITSAITIALAFGASAQVATDGYYRVKNYTTNRYVYVMDNRGSLNFQATTADLGAIEVWMDPQKRITDPASIIYVKALDNRRRSFDLLSQGTGVYEIISYPVSIFQKRNGAQEVYGTNSGLSRFIGDAAMDLNDDKGLITSQGRNEYHLWRFLPLGTSTAGDAEYFGLEPELSLDGKYYTSFFASFPYGFASQGMEAYYVSKVFDNLAAYKKVEGNVPAESAVIVRCSAQQPQNNVLNIGAEAQPLQDNLLNGIYFENYSNRTAHRNLTPYDPATMRVLGLTSEGKLGFVTATGLENLPRNRAYLKVAAGSPAELTLVTPEELDEYIAQYGGISDSKIDAFSYSVSGRNLTVYNAGQVEVFNTLGHCIYKGTATGAIELPTTGVYILHAGEHTARFLAR